MSEEKRKIFKTLSNPIRREILEYIGIQKSVSYTDLTKKFNIKSGPLYYHLKQMNLYIDQDKQKKYMLTPEGEQALEIVAHEKSTIQSVQIGRFSFQKIIALFDKHLNFWSLTFIAFGALSVYVGYHGGVILVAGFIFTYDSPLWIGYISFFGSWVFTGLLCELTSRYGFKKKGKWVRLVLLIGLSYLPSILFLNILGLLGLLSGVTIEVPKLVMIILHGVLQIWSVLTTIALLRYIKKLTIERSTIIAMVTSYIQIFTLIFILI